MKKPNPDIKQLFKKICKTLLKASEDLDSIIANCIDYETQEPTYQEILEITDLLEECDVNISRASEDYFELSLDLAELLESVEKKFGEAFQAVDSIWQNNGKPQDGIRELSDDSVESSYIPTKKFAISGEVLISFAQWLVETGQISPESDLYQQMTDQVLDEEYDNLLKGFDFLDPDEAPPHEC